MNPLMLLGISLGVAMDAFAVAVACSLALRRVTFRQTFRLAFHFGLFQALMPILGWAAGNSVHGYIQSWDHWVAFVMLAIVGGKAIWEALRGGDEVISKDPTRGMSLVVFSLATSIDALAVGVSVSMIWDRILFPAAVIGIVTAIVTGTGMILGARIGSRFRSGMELAGGVILVAIGLKVLLSHLV